MQKSQQNPRNILTIQQDGRFSLNLTQNQMKKLQKMLPPEYSLKKNPSNFQTPLKEQSKLSQITVNQSSIVSQKQNFNNNIQLKRCRKILGILHRYKCSWPFHEPVRPIEMGIPQYFYIIKNPMDLKTVSLKLAQQKYKNYEQFDADIRLIISNSYTFNKGNYTFQKITAEFQKAYNKLASSNQNQISKEPQVQNSPSKQVVKSAQITHNLRQFTANIITKSELIKKFMQLTSQQKQSLSIRINGDQNMTILNFNSLNPKQLKLAKRLIQNYERQNLQPSNQIFQKRFSKQNDQQSPFESSSD